MVREDKLNTYSAYQAYQRGKNEAWRRMPVGLSFSEIGNTDWGLSGEVSIAKMPRDVMPVWSDEFLYQALQTEDYQTFLLKGNVDWRDNHNGCSNGFFVVETSAHLRELSTRNGVRRLDILVKKDAVLVHERSINANGYDYITVSLEAGARYEQRVALGSEKGYRGAVRILLLGEGSSVVLSSGIVSTKAKISDHVLIEHCAPNTESEHQMYSVVQEAVDVYSTVNVHNNAPGTKSTQKIRHLLLEETACSFSKPALNIAIDDVESEHGAVSGMLDEVAMFYMQSRGLDIETAKRLFVKGYIEGIHSDKGLSDYLHMLLDNEYA